MRTGIAAIVIVAACGKGDGEDKGKAAERTMAARATEAEVHLRSLQKELAMYAVETARFPEGNVPLTPAKPCCQGPDQMCPAGGFDAEVWRKLGFAIDVPHRFQFRYEQAGDEVTIEAVGDLDCDGTPVTYMLTGTLTSGGDSTFSIQRPAMPD